MSTHPSNEKSASISALPLKPCYSTDNLATFPAHKVQFGAVD